MRYRFAIFWIAVAVVEIMHRLRLPTPFWLDAAGAWLVLVMTLLPVYEAVLEFQIDEHREGIRTGLWAVLGFVTLLAGPNWLRFD
jgi:TRAP-type mannitol/chloroaromatic compound transport system permease small subunit